jgi:hypothetical protein
VRQIKISDYKGHKCFDEFCAAKEYGTGEIKISQFKDYCLLEYNPV